MKKIISSLLLFAISLSVFAGCNSSGNKSDSKLNVYTSFYAMYDFTEKIGGDKINVTNLVPAGVGPHDWEPSTTDITNLNKADVLIYNGAGMEHWVDKVLGSLENKDLVVVEASKGISLIEGHHHHEDEEAKEAEDAITYDPHVWLSIKNAKAEMETIKNALVKADPENAAYYEGNYKTYAEKFDTLDKEYTDTLSALPNKDIIVAHQAFGYLCKDYGLNQVAIEGLSADSEPDPARMAEIIEFAKENKIKTIFFEELVSPKVADTIANEIGAKTAVLNPLGGLSDDEIKNGEDYLSVMKSNLEELKSALQ